ncbi:Alkaline phosphatase family protein [Vibrio crassostreae]|nr:Alkaline phosphatase family protein [Vibrio crassostreae]CAK2570646.1 Alkaline phosphatase family protein [Vibrio crassostreae]CAK2587302.1 Alkaline phosphatase family protein [Vibrio crassostreae]CAK2587549.1 Alkaline phosphatase family protein [Vibrio crassostreae]CAK2587730.1 Alkaline phosphatase family protein [Vibrio crassostreae]
MKPSTTSSLPLLLAGPILRKTTATEVVIWLATSSPLIGRAELYVNETDLVEEIGQSNVEQDQPFYTSSLDEHDSIQVGTHAWVTLIRLQGQFPTNTLLEYDIRTDSGSLKELAPHLVYNGKSHVEFKISTSADYILHGSCRNPHHPSKDSLVAADNKIAEQTVAERPDMLMMSGDQIYADHVAGPTLDAIQQVIQLLGLVGESLPTDSQIQQINSSGALYNSEYHLYQRHHYLPHHTASESMLDRFFPNRGMPIFSSTDCENHLVTLSEFIAMYLLVWSPTLWQCINRERLIENNFMQAGRQLTPAEQQQWRDESVIIDDFIAGLPQVQRLFAHIPTYMIFDDHDVTDDWNLTVGWEYAVDQNQFATQVIGNGLAAYWMCQGWGNKPESFDEAFIEQAKQLFVDHPRITEQTHNEAGNPATTHSVGNIEPDKHQAFIEMLNRFEEWHYTIDTSPKVIVLDTRTRRWRSESRMNKPSGLMDWEALIEFQHQLMNQDKVVIVSAAPMFGVKFIETLQKMATTIGKPLVIDAENWMAHPGSANTLISIFTHTKTPTNFVVLSGDVHYSFAYDIKLRYRRNSPNIYQITCSGIKNQFPAPLLKFCDVWDRLLYSPRSILNYFTKRKRLKIEKRSPDNQTFYRLSNRSAIGELRLDTDGKPQSITTLSGDGKVTRFPKPD